jgi:hypothetical protein
MSDILSALRSSDPIGELEKIKATMNSDKFKSEMQTALKSLSGQNNNRPNPISVSDIKHEYEIKDQLDSYNILDYQDKEEIFNC